jgi:dihydroorotate dehydrogenase (fumarate)
VTVDLRTRYLGLELRSPLVASPSPLTGSLNTALALVEAGAAALVLPSLFEEEIIHEGIELHRSLEAGSDGFAEALHYFPTFEAFAFTGDRYLEHLSRLKAACAVPVIASLNAATPGGWVRYARLMQDAGADALELNLYHLAADPGRSAGDMEARDLALIAAVREAISIPLAVKLSPYYSALASFARSAVEAGANGLVLFNRFYTPDLDLESLEVVARLELSTPAELRLPMRWIAILRPQLGPDVALAATSGIHGGQDVMKALLVGADVAMTTSALLQRGPRHLRTMEAELVAWLAEHEYESVAQARGSASQAAVEDPAAFERANYLRTLRSWSTSRGLTPAGRG